MDWWPSWAKFKLPSFKDLGTNSALDPLIYVLLAALCFTVLSAFFSDKFLLKFMVVMDGILGLGFLAAFFLFAVRDPDRLAPPSHQRYMAKLLRDERRGSGPLIQGSLTSNTENPSQKAITNG